MWHTIFIAAHAITGTAALILGLAMLRYRSLFGGYLYSNVAMEAFLLLAIVAEWGAIGTGARIMFGALAGLGAVVLWCAVRAKALRPATGQAISRKYFAYVGFTLVALFDAFVVITVLNAGAPGWAVAGSGVAVAIAGHFVLRATEPVHGRTRQFVDEMPGKEARA